jgi:hypothetical protein
MFNTTEKIKQLTRLLYPTGRAYNMPTGGAFEKLHSGLAQSEGRAVDDADSILFSILPDNTNFTVDDAEDWERRLGLITNALVSLDDRKAAIIRKMNHPGDIPARQSWDYLQQSLQAAGFDVYIHENIPEQSVFGLLQPFSGTAQQGQAQQGQVQQGTVITANSNLFVYLQQGQAQQGQVQQGAYVYTNLIANNINESLDAYFNIGSNWRSVFWIGGTNIGDFANVDINRKDEFRQIVLRIKPVQSIAYLLINYI